MFSAKTHPDSLPGVLRALVSLKVSTTISPLLAGVSLACLMAASAHAAPDEVLFIGNSFTIGGTSTVPVIFDRLAIAGGQGDPTTVMRAVGGKNYQFHETDPTSQADIASRKWTHVVLQNYSSEPTHIGSVADHLQYGDLLYQRVMANNPATKVVLFETWSRAASHEIITGTSTATTFASTAEMQTELRQNYATLAANLNATYPANPPTVIAPVGDAWENAGGMLAEAHPFFTDLHTTDNYHGNNNGYYLAAAVIYATIYHTSPEGLHLHSAVSSLNLNLTNPAALERQAWDTVTGNTGIRFLTQPQSVEASPGQSTTFTSTVRGAVPYQVQWYRNDEPVPGATGLSLTVPAVAGTMNGDVYVARVTNAAGTTPSAPATLSVTADTAAPVALAPSLVDPLTVVLPFDEALLSGPASQAGNFTVIHQGQIVPVTSTALSPDGKSVTLTLGAAIGQGFTVGVSPAVGDLSGNVPVHGSVIVSKAPAPAIGQVFIDFGATNLRTTSDPSGAWNNVDAVIGTTNTGTLNPLVGSDGLATGARLEMIRRFNGTNSNGAPNSGIYPATATQDSLYGNTETFNSLSNIFPAFRIAGLNPAGKYTRTFYASRSATDNRTALYTVTGSKVSTTTLNASSNVATTATLADLSPSAAGELVIELSPHTSNNNANHFTYLGGLVISSSAQAAPVMRQPVMLHGHVIVDWSGPGVLESSPDLSSPWVPVTPAPSPPFVEIQTGKTRFYRLNAASP